MHNMERAGAPALGNAIGYFLALYLINKQDWLGPEHTDIAVAMMGTICIHILFELRLVTAYLWGRFNARRTKG